MHWRLSSTVQVEAVRAAEKGGGGPSLTPAERMR